MNIGATTTVNLSILGDIFARRGEKTRGTNIGDVGETEDNSVTFEDSLNEAAEETERFGAPDRWTGEHLYTIDENTPEGYRVNKDALSRVKKQLEAEGIDAGRTPTHEITDEQMEWLSSRYDLDFLSACSFTHEDYGNFMLDLAYLNVFSLDEVENMFGVMPFNSNHRAYLYKIDTGDGVSGYVNPFGGTENYVEQDDLYTQLIMEYLKVKCTGRSEKEYERMAGDFAAQRAERMSVITEFFARFAAGKANAIDAAKPDIENIYEKLKEDFGVSV